MPPGSQLQPVPSLHCTVTADPRWLRAAHGGCTHLDLGANNQGSLCSPYAPATAHLQTAAAATAGDWRGCEAACGCGLVRAAAPLRALLSGGWGRLGDPEGMTGIDVRAFSRCVFSGRVESSPKAHKRWRSQHLSRQTPKFTPNKEVELLPRPLPPTAVPRTSPSPNNSTSRQSLARR